MVHNTAVHNIHSGAQHMHDTETFRQPERQVASTMISVLAGTSISVLEVVVRGAKKHYVKTEQTLSTLQPRNCRGLGRTGQDLTARSHFINA